MKKIAEHTLGIEDLDEAIEDWFHKYGYLEDTDDVDEVRIVPVTEGAFITLWIN